MHRLHSITHLAPLFSVLPLSAWLMLVASTLFSLFVRSTSAGQSLIQSKVSSLRHILSGTSM